MARIQTSDEEQEKLLAWIEQWCSDYRMAKFQGNDPEMIQAAEDMEIAAQRLNQLAQEDGI